MLTPWNPLQKLFLLRGVFCKGPPFDLLTFWPCRPSFPFILALWAFILALWAFILALWALLSFHFGLVGLHFLSFWHCWPSFPFILAFWRLASGVPPPPHKLPKTVRFPKVPYKEFSSARPGSIFQFLAFWAFISFHFGLLGLHFLSFWPFGPSFPFILALWAFISFHFGLVGLHFLAFWPFAAQLLGSTHPPQVAKNCPFAQCPYNGFISAGTGSILQFLAPIFGFFGLHFLSFWPFGPSFPFILAFWAFIGFHLLSFWPSGPPFPFILAFIFLSFWPSGPSFPFILAFWAFISHIRLVGLHFLSLWPFGPSFPCILACWWLACGVSPLQVAKYGPFSQGPTQRI